jgi:hypothetical protein
VPVGETEGAAEVEAPPEGVPLCDGDADAEALRSTEPVGGLLPVLLKEVLGMEVGQGEGVPVAPADSVALPSAVPLRGAVPVPLPVPLPLFPEPRVLPLRVPHEEGDTGMLRVRSALSVGAPLLPLLRALPLALPLPPQASAVAVGEAPDAEELARGEGVCRAALGVGESL